LQNFLIAPRSLSQGLPTVLHVFCCTIAKNVQREGAKILTGVILKVHSTSAANCIHSFIHFIS